MKILEELLGKKEVVSPDGSRIPLHSSINKEEGEFLQRLVAAVRPVVSLEVGLAYGVSALFICEALAKVGAQAHIVIDPSQTGYWQGIGLRYLKEAGYGHLIKHYALESQAALPNIVAEGTRIDFAFIDGWHTFDHALVDFFYIDKLLNVGGIVAFDDAGFPAIHKLCRFVATNRNYKFHGQVGGTPESSKHRALNWLAKFPLIHRVLQNRFTNPDENLGFHSNSDLIAFEKITNDTRNWDSYHEF